MESYKSAMDALYEEYGITEEIDMMKQAMQEKSWLEYVESADTDYREELIGSAINNVTTKAFGISGEAFVSTMSDSAVNFFAD